MLYRYWVLTSNVVALKIEQNYTSLAFDDCISISADPAPAAGFSQGFAFNAANAFCASSLAISSLRWRLRRPKNAAGTK